MVLTNVIVPVILVAGAGFLFARLTHGEAKPLTRLSFYILTPALIFHSMLNRSVSMIDLADVALFVLIVHGLLTLIGFLGVRWTGWDADTKTSAILSLSFNNCGNYGLPVLLFAFGGAGFTLGVVYMVAHMVYLDRRWRECCQLAQGYEDSQCLPDGTQSSMALFILAGHVRAAVCIRATHCTGTAGGTRCRSGNPGPASAAGNGSFPCTHR